MTTNQLVRKIESLGSLLVLQGDRVRYEVPISAAPLLDDLRMNRDAVVDLLRTRRFSPAMPNRVRLIRCEPKTPPVVLTRWSVVIDVPEFVESTLEQLGAALSNKNWLAGNWSVQELVDRLEQVGVRVEITTGCEVKADVHRELEGTP